jgi:hypothetical protein
VPQAAEDHWRRRAEALASQLEILRVAHVGLARRDRELREEAARFRAATALPRYVVRSTSAGVVYEGPSREAAITAARNATWRAPMSRVEVFDGECVVWSSRLRASA